LPDDHAPDGDADPLHDLGSFMRGERARGTV
jgi:hypothetical protein